MFVYPLAGSVATVFGAVSIPNYSIVNNTGGTYFTDIGTIIDNNGDLSLVTTGGATNVDWLKINSTGTFRFVSYDGPGNLANSNNTTASFDFGYYPNGVVGDNFEQLYIESFTFPAGPNNSDLSQWDFLYYHNDVDDLFGWRIPKGSGTRTTFTSNNWKFKIVKISDLDVT
jgi:hypothetical protein